MNEPLVTIIIPARNAEETIDNCIVSVLSVNYNNYEVIVVDDGSQDATSKIIQKYTPRIQVISNPFSLGPSKSRNIASYQAKGEYLAFTDADCFVDKDWLKELLRGLEERSERVSCGGTQELPQDSTSFEKKVFSFLKKTGLLTDYMRKDIYHIGIFAVRHNPSCNVIYKRDIFLKEGGFLEGFWPGEDVELDYRLVKKGYRLVFNPKAIVYHHRPKALRHFLTMMYRYGWAQGALVRRYGLFRKVHLLPFLNLLFILSIFVLGLFNTTMVSVFILSAILLFLFYFFDFTVLLLFLLGNFYWNCGFSLGLLKGLTLEANKNT